MKIKKSLMKFVACAVVSFSVLTMWCCANVQPPEKFQEKYSMDWDSIDASMLQKIAEYHGGSVEDRAYTIIVTLNKVFAENRTIQEVVLEELYEVDGLSEFEYESIVIGDLTREAYNMVLYDRWDETGGSLKYIEFETDQEKN